MTIKVEMEIDDPPVGYEMDGVRIVYRGEMHWSYALRYWKLWESMEPSVACHPVAKLTPNSRIKRLMDRIDKDLQDAKEAYEIRRKHLQGKILDLQKECPHPQVDHHPDPSGNNDSEFVCAACRKTVRHRRNMFSDQEPGEE